MTPADVAKYRQELAQESELMKLIRDYGRKCQDYGYYGEQDTVSSERKWREARDSMDDLIGRIKRKVVEAESNSDRYKFIRDGAISSAIGGPTAEEFDAGVDAEMEKSRDK